MNVRVVIAGVLAVLWMARPAMAQPGRTPIGPPQAYAPPDAPTTYTKRYGTSMALADAASTAAVLVGAVIVIGSVLGCIDECDGNDGAADVGVALMIGGAAGYVFGGPLIHTSQGNRSGAGKSIALRLGLPLAGALVGAALDKDCSGDDVCESNPISGYLTALGVVSAMVTDWVVFAKKEVWVGPPVMPYAAPMAGGGMTIGLGGSF